VGINLADISAILNDSMIVASKVISLGFDQLRCFSLGSPSIYFNPVSTFEVRNFSAGKTAKIIEKFFFFSDAENPKVTMCPTSFEVNLSPGERNRLIFWQEPTFTDNVGVEYVYKTRVSGKE